MLSIAFLFDESVIKGLLKKGDQRGVSCAATILSICLFCFLVAANDVLAYLFVLFFLIFMFCLYELLKWGDCLRFFLFILDCIYAISGDFGH